MFRKFSRSEWIDLKILNEHVAVPMNGGSKNRNSRNPPKFTKSSVYINHILPSATKSTFMKQKLSKSNVSSHEINGFDANPVLFTKSTHSTRMLKFKLEATSISSTVHVRQPDNVGRWRCWLKQLAVTIGLLKRLDFVNFGGFRGFRFLDPPADESAGSGSVW